MFRTPLAYALLAFAAPGLSATAPGTTTTAAKPAAPRITNAWVRLNPVPGRPSAGYLTIAGTGTPDRLTAVTAPGARIEMHSMSMAGGVMKMAKLDGLDISANAATSFAPGGNHLMIFGLSGTPKTLPITLGFASGKTATVTAEIKAAGDDAHAGH
nr:copper chaperone PCu(A)C [Polymorphobacter sp.]